MKVFGLTNVLRSEVDFHCPESFWAWYDDVAKATFSGLKDLRKRYPATQQTSEHEFMIPLQEDGAGIRTQVFFDIRLLILCCVVPAPATSRITRFASHSPVPMQSR